ncbi:hypothetical protein C8R48DRAFT_668598 [Suillus tomentosus]|nr:hypothetical protein C8R48DRAFT_668598 [Suillus tomentosus]
MDSVVHSQLQLTRRLVLRASALLHTPTTTIHLMRPYEGWTGSASTHAEVGWLGMAYVKCDKITYEAPSLLGCMRSYMNEAVPHGSANSRSQIHTGLPKPTRPSLPLACSRAQVDSGKVISAATSVNINNSEKTTSTKANDVYHFSPLPRQCVLYSQAARGVASGWHQYHISYSYHVFIIQMEY